MRNLRIFPEGNVYQVPAKMGALGGHCGTVSHSLHQGEDDTNCSRRKCLCSLELWPAMYCYLHRSWRALRGKRCITTAHHTTAHNRTHLLIPSLSHQSPKPQAVERCMAIVQCVHVGCQRQQPGCRAALARITLRVRYTRPRLRQCRFRGLSFSHCPQPSVEVNMRSRSI